MDEDRKHEKVITGTKGKKAPQNAPVCGDRVCLRGRTDRKGTIVKWNITPENHECSVKWDDSDVLMLCHRFELARV